MSVGEVSSPIFIQQGPIVGDVESRSNPHSCCLSRIWLCLTRAFFYLLSSIGALFCPMSTPQDSSKVRLPVVTEQLKPGFFVDVINQGGYVLQGKKVIIPPAGKPVKCAVNDFKASLIALRNTLNSQRAFTVQFKNCTTEEAIDQSQGFRIAVNFANEDYIGGKPGVHRDPESGILVYHAASTTAQEESLGQRSTILASLTQLLHTFKKNPDSPFLRSCYAEEFDSTKMAYVSLNHLFAVPASLDFYESRYLSEPKAVTFITSAANYYRHRKYIDCSKGLDVYTDARQRIETHLLAAATSALASKKDKPDESVELILGAFGCGAFAPQGNPNIVI